MEGSARCMSSGTAVPGGTEDNHQANCLCRHMNPELPEYETGALPIWPIGLGRTRAYYTHHYWHPANHDEPAGVPSTAIRLRARGSGGIPAGAQDFSLLWNVQTGYGAQPTSHRLASVALSPKVKRLGSKADSSLQHSGMALHFSGESRSAGQVWRKGAQCDIASFR